MVELQGLQLRLPEFQQRNTEVVAIAVDAVERNAEVAANLGLGYRIGADPRLAAIDAFGLRHDREGEPPIARPATFLIDAGGIVRWRNLTENYRLRPPPQDILAQIDALP